MHLSLSSHMANLLHIIDLYLRNNLLRKSLINLLNVRVQGNKNI
jgi:hypothetical protein